MAELRCWDGRWLRVGGYNIGFAYLVYHMGVRYLFGFGGLVGLGGHMSRQY